MKPGTQPHAKLNGWEARDRAKEKYRVRGRDRAKEMDDTSGADGYRGLGVKSGVDGTKRLGRNIGGGRSPDATGLGVDSRLGTREGTGSADHTSVRQWWDGLDSAHQLWEGPGGRALVIGLR